MLFSGIALAGAAGIYFYTQFASLLWFLLASGLAIFAVVMTASVYRWHKFAQTSFVAINDTFLYFGNDKRAWRIAWDLLDAKALGFEDYESERLSGTLSLDVAGQKIDLHLYQPLAYIEDWYFAAHAADLGRAHMAWLLPRILDLLAFDDDAVDAEDAAVLVNFTLDAVTLGSDGWQIAADFLWQPFKQKRPFLRVNRQRHVPTHGDFAGSSRADFATKEHITWRIDGDRACAFGLCE